MVRLRKNKDKKYIFDGQYEIKTICYDSIYLNY